MFMHNETSRNRESVVISLGHGGYGGGGGSGDGGGGNSNVVVLGGGNGSGNGAQIVKPSNWKTKICNKWEITGYCPLGAKCHFAHGAAELHRFGEGLVEEERKDGVSPNPDIKQTGPNPKGHSDTLWMLTLRIVSVERRTIVGALTGEGNEEPESDRNRAEEAMQMKLAS